MHHMCNIIVICILMCIPIVHINKMCSSVCFTIFIVLCILLPCMKSPVVNEPFTSAAIYSSHYNITVELMVRRKIHNQAINELNVCIIILHAV